MHKRLILGSTSPRRQEILSFFSFPFEQLSPYFAEELVPFEGDPISYANTISKGKADSLASRYPQAVILTADTIVFKEGKLFLKPSDDDEALAMLTELNGSWHSVFTSVTVHSGDQQWTQCEETKVLFHTLSPEQLKFYHKAFKGTDKSGGYGIQTGGSVIVKRMEGCFYNVMGLPLGTVRILLEKGGIDLWHYLT